MIDPTLAILVASLKESEGFRSFPYDDDTWPSRRVRPEDCRREGGQYKVLRTGGTATIGYGETRADIIDQWWDADMPEPLAAQLLAERADRDYLQPSLSHLHNPGLLNPNQKAAIGSFAYNIGVGSWSTSTLCSRINAGRLDHDSIANAFHMWDNPDGSLRGRRQKEIDLFFTPGQPPERRPTNMFRFWHQGGLYLVVGPYRSDFPLNHDSHAVYDQYNKIVSDQGCPVVGNPDDNRQELVDHLIPMSALRA